MTRVPDYLIEALHSGTLDDVAGDAAAVSALKARIAADPQSAARLAALDDDNRAILGQLPPAAFAAEVHRRHRARSQRFVAKAVSAGAIFAAAAVAVVVVRTSGGTSDGTSGGTNVDGGATNVDGGASRGGIVDPGIVDPGVVDPGTDRAKGGRIALEVHRVRAGVEEELGEGAAVKAGDLLQLAYRAMGRRHGVVLSLDGAGNVTLHQPESAAAGSALTPGNGRVPLAHAYELDDAPGFERFWFVAADSPIDVDTVLAAARRLAADPAHARTGPLSLPSSSAWEQTSVLLEKAPR